MKRFLLLIFLLVFNSCCSIAVQAAGTEDRLDEVVLQLKWQHQFQFAGYYAAVVKGYYREAGLKVILKERKPGTAIADELVSGRAQCCFSDYLHLIFLIILVLLSDYFAGGLAFPGADL